MNIFHRHQWTFEKVQTLTEVAYTWDEGRRYIRGYTHVYVGTCSKCGDIKKKIIKA